MPREIEVVFEHRSPAKVSWTGDLSEMRERRLIRVLVPNNRSFFFYDGLQPRRLAYDIHAGVKYLRFVSNRYFSDAHFDELNRHAFAFAAYNAGPAHIRELRAIAAKEGLDPNEWFNSVEIVAGRKIGRETVDYVRNILEYWVAYHLALDSNEDVQPPAASDKQT